MNRQESSSIHPRAVLPAAILVALSCSSLVAAQTLEEVVVTAQKREQSLTDAPISISAFGTEALEQRRIKDAADIAGFVPNLQIVPTPSNSTSLTASIRGSVTINPAITWEPAVGVYVDGVFIGKNTGAIFDVTDLERVEVLRGPQGSLYGKNTIGGAINLVSRKPSGEFGARVTGSIGNEGYWRALGRIDTGAVGQIGEGLGRFSATITLQHEERDGFVDNVDDPLGNPFFLASPKSSSEHHNLDSDAGRIALMLEATDDLEIRYAYDFSDKDQQPTAAVLTAVDDPGLGFGPLLSPYVQSDSKYPSQVSNDSSYFERSDVEGHALNIDWSLGACYGFDDISIRSITAYRTLEWGDYLDLDGSPIDFFHSARDVDYDQFSQEFQWLATSDDLNIVLGAYWFEEQADVYNPITFFGVFGSPTLNNRYGLDNTSKALFGQVDWTPNAFERALTVTVGARYTEEEKDQYIDHPEVYGYAEDDEDWNNFSPSVTLTWAFNDDVNAYIRYAEGWKSGGFNGESDTLAGFYAAYDPEEVTSWEIGLKSRLMNDRLQLNVAAFANEVDDMQLSVFGADSSASSTIDNAGKASISGIEIEFAAQLTENLMLNANYGYLDSEYDEYIDGGVDVKNNRDFPYAPENTANAGIQYNLPDVAGGELSARLDWIYVDDRVAYTDPLQNLRSQLGSYDLINGRLSLADMPVPGGRLSVSAWGKNLTDEAYRINTIPFIIWTVSYFGQPRTYGLDVTYDFD